MLRMKRRVRVRRIRPRRRKRAKVRRRKPRLRKRAKATRKKPRPKKKAKAMTRKHQWQRTKAKATRSPKPSKVFASHAWRKVTLPAFLESPHSLSLLTVLFPSFP